MTQVSIHHPMSTAQALDAYRIAACATGMVKSPTSRTTVDNLGSSIRSGSRARNDRHKTDIDPDRDDGGRETRRRTQPQPPICPVVTNRFRHQVLRIEEQSISLDRLNANFAEYHHETLSFALPDSK